MATPANILLVEDNRIEAVRTQHWLTTDKDNAFAVEWCDQLQTGLERLDQGGIDLVVLDLNLPDSRDLATFQKLHQHSPEVPVVVLTGEYDENMGQLAVEEGAQDFLVKQQVDAHSLIRVMKHALARHRATRGDTKPRPARNAHVIGFIGVKGGVGTTTTALNIAQALGLKGKSTILIDLHPTFGMLSYQLQPKPQTDLSTLLKLPPEKIGASELEAVLYRARDGLQVLLGPEGSDQVEEIDSEHTEAIIGAAAGLADFVILDLPNQPTASVISATRRCQRVILVSERDPSSMIAGKLTLERLSRWGINKNLVVAILVNRASVPNAMTVDELTSGLGCTIFGTIPTAGAAHLWAFNQGVPLVAAQPESDAAFYTLDIAGKLAVPKEVGA